MKDGLEYIYPVGDTENLFWVYADVPNINFLVEIDAMDLEKIQKAQKIANDEFEKWASAEREDDEYWDKGYAEVVAERLNENRILHTIYVPMEE